MAKEHEILQHDLPDYARGRLAPARATEIERHVAECPECRELVGGLRDLAEGMKDGGEALFAPHPDPATLRRFASGQAGTDGARVETHAALCVSCRLEIDTLRRHAAGDRPADAVRPAARSGLTPWTRLAIAAAAGLAAGVLITIPFRTGRERPPRNDAPPAPASTPAPAVDPSVAIGQTVLHLLPNALRDGAPAPRRWVLDPGESYIAVAFPVDVPADAADDEVYRVEILRNGAGVRWSADMTAARLREHMNASEAVHLPAVPTRALPSGTYELRVRSMRDPGAPPLFKATVEIAYRQSPAATKAPQ